MSALFDTLAPSVQAAVDLVLNIKVQDEPIKALDACLDAIEVMTEYQVTEGEVSNDAPIMPSSKKLLGRLNNVKTAKGTKIETQFALVEANTLITSHNSSGGINSAFPQELQPRDRSREASQAWVQKVAASLDNDSLGRTGRADTGAPIVGDDLVVESGNGRTMAIKLAYERGTAVDYRDWLIEEADYFGFKPENVEAMSEPVLVRIRQTEIDRSAFAVEANQDDKLSFTATERAKADSKRLDESLITLFVPSEDGDLMAVSNFKFIQGFLKSLGETEAAQYITKDGKPTQALIMRIKAAIFSKAYGDDRLLEMVADQNKPELQNVLNALGAAAPKFIEAQAFGKPHVESISEKIVDSIEHSLDERIVNAIVEATNVLMSAKANDQDVSEFVKQQGLFGDLAEGVPELAVFLAKNSRNAKKMTIAFKAMADFVKTDAVNQTTESLFGEPIPPTMAEVVDAANRALERVYGKENAVIGLFDAYGKDETYVDDHVEEEILKDNGKQSKYLQVLDSITEGSGKWSIVAKKPELNDDTQSLFQIVRDDGVVLSEYLYFADAERVCLLLNENKKLFKEIAEIDFDKPMQLLDSAVSDQVNALTNLDTKLFPLAALEACLQLAQTIDAGHNHYVKIDFSGTYSIRKHEEVMQAINDGTITLEDYKQGFEELTHDYKQVEIDAATLTKAEVIHEIESYGGYVDKSRTKPQLIEKYVNGMFRAYSLAQFFSFSPSYGGGRQGYIDSYVKAVQRDIDKETQETLDIYAAGVAVKRKEQADRKEEIKKGMDNPQTITDFSNVVRDLMESKNLTMLEAMLLLTPEQRQRYDTLAAKLTREKRVKETESKKTQVTVASQTTAGKIIETKHTKQGHDLFVVQMADRLERDAYNAVNAQAKRLGGYYSMYRGGGAVVGFQFKTRENAEAFLKLLGGDATDAQNAAVENRNVFIDDKNQSAVERLTEMSKRLLESANEQMNRERKVNTHRRAGFAASAEAKASADKALALTMQNIADAIQSGRAEFLDKVRQKTQVEFLKDLIKSAKYQEICAKYPNDYGKQEANRGEAVTTDTVSYVALPLYKAYQSDLAGIARALIVIDGTKRLGQDLLKLTDDTSAEYDKFAKDNISAVSKFTTTDGNIAITSTKEAALSSILNSGLAELAIPLKIRAGQYAIVLSPSAAISRGIWKGADKLITIPSGLGKELVDKIGSNNRKFGGIKLPWTFESTYAAQKKMQSMDLNTGSELRTALREFVNLSATVATPDPIKALERAMIGRVKDGLDFFPTPQNIAQEMIDIADIKQGMTVLEPSAGMGHIAEMIRDAGVEPDVVEYSSGRRELLEAKGFNVIGNDFMDIKDASYDRIIMNPPFSDRRDIEHVKHAYSLLKQGGRLVSVMGEGAFFGQDQKAAQFRDWLDGVGGSSEKLGEGSFNDPSLPVTTGASTRMVVITKGGSNGGVFDSIDDTLFDDDIALFDTALSMQIKQAVSSSVYMLKKLDTDKYLIDILEVSLEILNKIEKVEDKLDSRNSFTVSRMRDDNKFTEITFERGEMVKISSPKVPWELVKITGISQARDEFKTDRGTWMSFGYVEKADYDEFAKYRKQAEYYIGIIENQLKNGYTANLDGFFREADDAAKDSGESSYEPRIKALREQRRFVTIENKNKDNLKKEAEALKKQTELDAKNAKEAARIPEPDLEMTMEKWEKIHRNFKGTFNGQRMAMVGGKMRNITIVAKPKKPEVDPSEKLIKIAADSVETLRKSDVYRVLAEQSLSDSDILGLARYISEKRPDLIAEVNECLADINIT
jgi:hypothetical protein